MKTLIELYDPAHPVKNILAALIFKPEVLIFIGLKGSLTAVSYTHLDVYKRQMLTYKEFNTQALYDELDFEPKVSFQEGIKKTIEWLRERE